ncbi:ATP-dependent helicase [Alteromonas phage vB_AmeP_PT11-V19]|nr:ATP-dependent helicase [Alteromonas phage vB_AmeP_PT11-V19]
MSNIKTALDYVSTPSPEDTELKISPSAFPNFVERPHYWYQTQILKENVFEYNTMSVVGTIVHYCAEMIAKGKEVDEAEIEKYISKHKPKEDFDQEYVRAHWLEAASVLVNQYVLRQSATIIEAEKQVCASLGDGYYVAGTLDLLQGTKEDALLVDYKTYRSKTKPKAIPANYRYQLLVYAWALRQLGYNVTRIRLCYVNAYIDGGISEKTNKPLKSYPSELTVLTETIEEKDFEFIESMLMLCKETYQASLNYPDLRHVIYHDPRLKA